jgi:hypothetical protein
MWIAISLLVLGGSEAVSDETAARQAPVSVLGMEPGNWQLCNDDVGVILWGPDCAPTLSVGKSDVWDRRNPKPPQPVLTMAKIIEMANAGDKSILNGRGYYTTYCLYDFPCPKPVGQMILKLDFMRDGGELKADPGEASSIRLRARKGDKAVHLSIYVSAVRNLIVVSGTASNLAQGDVSIRLYRHRDTILPGGKVHPTLGDGVSGLDFEQLPMPGAGAAKDCFWIAQGFPGEPTFPDGFTGVLAARVVGSTVDVTAEEARTGLGTPMVTDREGRISHVVNQRYTPINESPGSAATASLGAMDGPFLFLASVVTTQDSPDPVAQARKDLDAAAKLGESGLWTEHKKQLDDYGKRQRVRAWSDDGKTVADSAVGGVPWKLRPAGYYGDVALCSVGSTKFCFQDSAPWHGDFHFNEVEATGPCVLRQFDSMDSYFRLIHSMLPMAQANARRLYDCSGAMYSLAHYPLRSDTVIYHHVAWEQSMEISALLAKPFWLRFQYTWDMGFLKELAYPVLREGARFYADYLKKENDGLYHVFPTVSPEHRGITKNLEFNKDSQSGITLTRYHLRAAAEAAKLMKVDDKEAARWRDIADHMPDYPTYDTPEGPMFTDVAGAQPMEYNIAVPLTSVFWGDDIGLESPPEQLELARRTLRLINVWEPHRFYLTRVRQRLGIYDPADPMSADNFLQSYTGVIRVFPTVPDDFAGGFENLGAQGAFVVSAKRAKAGVESITLESLAGNPASVANPWSGKGVRVTDITSKRDLPDVGTDRILRFPTSNGHVYVVTMK